MCGEYSGGNREFSVGLAVSNWVREWMELNGVWWVDECMDGGFPSGAQTRGVCGRYSALYYTRLA